MRCVSEIVYWLTSISSLALVGTLAIGFLLTRPRCPTLLFSSDLDRVHHFLCGQQVLLREQLPMCRSCHPVASGLPIRRSHRKCDAIPARNDMNSVYRIPKSRQVCSTSLEIAG